MWAYRKVAPERLSGQRQAASARIVGYLDEAHPNRERYYLISLAIFLIENSDQLHEVGGCVSIASLLFREVHGKVGIVEVWWGWSGALFESAPLAV